MSLGRTQSLAGALMLCAVAACANAPRLMPADAARDGFVARLKALALLQTLNADLLSHDSATQTLERWCGARRLASPPKMTAERVMGIDTEATSEQRLDLKVGPAEPLRYRRVKLRCGELVLSEADNWYVPSRLTPQMNALLDSSDTPFGKVVQPLHFQRRTLSASLLWLPLPEGWEMAAPASERQPPLEIPGKVLEHRAVLVLPDGEPISEVVETYTGNVLAKEAARR